MDCRIFTFFLSGTSANDGTKSTKLQRMRAKNLRFSKNLFGVETRKKCDVERKTQTLNGVNKKREGKGV